MRIAAVDVDLILLPAVTPPYAWRHGLRGSHPARTTAVLRITTDDGAVGEAYHEWSGPMLADIVDRILREELVGERADRREWLWHRLWELDRTEEFPIWVFGIVDVAVQPTHDRRRRSGHRRLGRPPRAALLRPGHRARDPRVTSKLDGWGLRFAAGARRTCVIGVMAAPARPHAEAPLPSARSIVPPGSAGGRVSRSVPSAAASARRRTR